MILNRRSFYSNLIIGLILTIGGGFFISIVQIADLSGHVFGNLGTAVSLITVAVVAFSLSPARRLLTHIAEDHIFKGDKADRDAFRSLSERLLKSSDLLSVVTASIETISARLDIPYAVSYILQKGEHGSLSVKQVVPWHHPSPNLPSLDHKEIVLHFLTSYKRPVTATALREELAEEEALLKSGNEPKGSAQQDFIKNHAAKSELLSLLDTLKTEVTIPLLAKDQLFGLMFLSQNTVSRPFNIEEISFLETAVTETITSIQRANYFEGDLQKTEFISIASHELRTPLTAIRGYLSMILDEKLTGTELNSESTDQLNKAYELTRQLIAMVNDLLTLSRLESGKTKIEPQQIDMLEIARKQVTKHKLSAEAKHVTVLVDNKRNLPYTWADPEGVGLVLDCLIANAITYNKEGGQVHIRIHSHVADGMVALEVRDTGIGIAKDQMNHLFEKFYRVASDETQGISGTGLGLNITQTYVRRMNGSIRVHSIPGKGTSFIILLPLFTPDKLRQEVQATLQQEVQAGSEIHSDIPIGLILLSGKRSEEPYSTADLNLLEAVGHQAIITIQRAKLYEGDQMKTQFVSIASHELLTPIAAIEGYITLILEKDKTVMAPKTAEFLGNVGSAIHRLSSLVRDLLSVSRLESGRITIAPVSFDIAKSIKETLAQLEFVAADRNVTLSLDPIESSTPLVFADPERTTQVLMNLVGNAIKYNKVGGKVTINVSSMKTSPVLKVSISDSGIGMDKEAMSHLFEKFYRITTQETVGIIGTGLGLYITKSIVERMGGSISVKSTIGKGSTFTVSLPTTKPLAVKK